MKKLLKQLFCFHSYQIITDMKQDMKDIYELKNGQSIVMVREHVCRNCGKTIVLGSGLIC